MDPHQYAEQKAAPRGSNLHYTIRALPAERRHAAVALYAVTNEISDIAREVDDPGVARTKLLWWREELGRLYDGKPRHPASRALAPALATYDIPRERLEDVLHGAAMDLEYNAYPDFDALLAYCRRVGGAPARLFARVLGYTDARTDDYADELGVALELTRIVRDVGVDARRGRVYIPLHELAGHGVTSDDLAHARESANFRKLVGFQIARARQGYERAIARLPAADRGPQRPGLALAAINRALLAEIEDDGCRVLTRRIALTPLRKLWIAWRTR